MNRYATRARITYPYGCAACGQDERSHLTAWQEEVGLHLWIRPSLEHVKARMRQRRANSLRRRYDVRQFPGGMHPAYRAELAEWARIRRQSRANRRHLRLKMARLRREGIVGRGRKNGKTSLQLITGGESGRG